MRLAAICVAACVLTGCAKNIDTPEAVREGVIKDIAKKVDVASMDVNVDSVSFREKEADASVSFTPRGADRRTQSITMNYHLERQGDEWHIKSRDMQAQHTQTALPPGHPSAGEIKPGTPLPPGHPAVPTNPKQ